MLSTSLPTKFPIPFANNAGGGFIRSVPQASQIGVQNGAASLYDGFPPNCFIPIASGGSWPYAQDFNGILKQITQWSQWLQAGATTPYDATFQTALAGYPKNAVIGSATTAGLFWISTTENNLTNPDTGGAGWSRWPLTRSGEVVAADLAAGVAASNVGGLGGVLTGTLPNPGMAAGAAVTNIGFTPVQQGGGAGQSTNKVYLGWDGTATLPRIQVDASDRGNVAMINQFTSSLGANGWKRIPDISSPSGYVLEQWGSINADDNTTTIGTFPIAFPNSIMNFTCSFSASLGSNTYAASGQAISLSQFEVTNTNPGSSNLGMQWSAKGY